MMTALMYHDVVEAGAQDSSGFPGRDAALYKVTPQTFELLPLPRDVSSGVGKAVIGAEGEHVEEASPPDAPDLACDALPQLSTGFADDDGAREGRKRS